MKNHSLYPLFLMGYFPLSKTEDYHLLGDHLVERDYKKVLELSDWIDDILEMYAMTVPDMFRAENGQEVFRVKERGISYPNTTAHYDVLCDIEDRTLVGITVNPISDIAKERLTPELIGDIKRALGFPSWMS